METIARESLPAALETGAEATLADIGITATFDLAHPRAVTYLEEAAAALVTRVNETTRARIGEIVTTGAQAGTSYAKIARAIVDDFAEMAILKPQRHIRNRAELIAITELGQAYEESGSIVARDLTRSGIAIEKYWSTTGDNLVKVISGAGETGNCQEWDDVAGVDCETGYFAMMALDLNDGGTRPTCDSSTRGYMWIDEGGAGVADSVAVCAKDSGDAYAWRTIY